MERDITTKHWLPNDSEHSYTWHTLDIEAVAAHYHTTQKKVRETMKRIEAKHPKPVARHQLPNLRANHQAATHVTSAVRQSFGCDISRVTPRLSEVSLPMATNTPFAKIIVRRATRLKTKIRLWALKPRQLNKALI